MTDEGSSSSARFGGHGGVSSRALAETRPVESNARRLRWGGARAAFRSRRRMRQSVARARRKVSANRRRESTTEGSPRSEVESNPRRGPRRERSRAVRGKAATRKTSRGTAATRKTSSDDDRSPSSPRLQTVRRRVRNPDGERQTPPGRTRGGIHVERGFFRERRAGRDPEPDEKHRGDGSMSRVDAPSRDEPPRAPALSPHYFRRAAFLQIYDIALGKRTSPESSPASLARLARLTCSSSSSSSSPPRPSPWSCPPFFPRLGLERREDDLPACPREPGRASMSAAEITLALDLLRPCSRGSSGFFERRSSRVFFAHLSNAGNAAVAGRSPCGVDDVGESMRVDRLLAAHDPHEHLGHVAPELDVRVDDVFRFFFAAAEGAEEVVDVLLGDLAVGGRGSTRSLFRIFRRRVRRRRRGPSRRTPCASPRPASTPYTFCNVETSRRRRGRGSSRGSRSPPEVVRLPPACGRLLRQAQDLVQIVRRSDRRRRRGPRRPSRTSRRRRARRPRARPSALAAGHRAPRTEPSRRTRAEGGASSSGRTSFSNATLPGERNFLFTKYRSRGEARARHTPWRTSRTRGGTPAGAPRRLPSAGRSSNLLSAPTLSPRRTRRPPRRGGPPRTAAADGGAIFRDARGRVAPPTASRCPPTWRARRRARRSVATRTAPSRSAASTGVSAASLRRRGRAARD